jgi:uncharacterized repeat protein (TIGR03803 family)
MPTSFPHRPVSRCSLAISIMIGLGTLPANSSETVLHSFLGGSDGATPESSLIADGEGNLYGTTALGGGGSKCGNGNGGCGTVFKLAPSGTETIVHAFAGGSDGSYPYGGLLADQGGDLFGTTAGGGGGSSIVFELAPDGAETILHTFQGGGDGFSPQGNLVADQNGNLYGTTYYGGNTGGACGSLGCGTVFEVAVRGTETVLYAFQGGSDGIHPEGDIVLDASGNLYGTTVQGGTGGPCPDGSTGCGTVFKLAPGGTKTVLDNFQGGSDGAFPRGGLLMGASGNLYGTTWSGGGCAMGDGCGTVFKVASDGSESVLYAFQAGSDGAAPVAGVVMDKAGNLNGTTYFGGSTRCHGSGCGTVFKVAPDGTETVLHAFGGTRGKNPAAALLAGKHGKLYGTTVTGGKTNDGVVFIVKK